MKKLTGPFRTQNIAAHMFRDVKLLKELRHDNVSSFDLFLIEGFGNKQVEEISQLTDIFISPTEDM